MKLKCEHCKAKILVDELICMHPTHDECELCEDCYTEMCKELKV